MDPTDEILVCKISGHCFDRLLSAAEMDPDTVSIKFPVSYFASFLSLVNYFQISIVFLAVKFFFTKLAPSVHQIL